ncbi:uncharacterized protein LOC62_01G001588 [Vanrija pseudolonga]|uniref:Uncharacterized protein n=1 Tax=Vanrija pseudolonga TaxID=143232 RepID=A0AAF0Y100_9TREE|nr:hypothetical protein LOC62_01G001588 [Vanrija pseudolonga]
MVTPSAAAAQPPVHHASPTAGYKLFDSPHLVDMILDQADKQTLSRVMRTAQRFFIPAGVGGDKQPSLVGLRSVLRAKTSLREQFLRRNFANYRLLLLSCTQVVTIEGPHSEWCDLPWHVMRQLFPNVKVVRVAPQQNRAQRTSYTSGSHWDGLCRLVVDKGRHPLISSPLARQAFSRPFSSASDTSTAPWDSRSHDEPEATIRPPVTPESDHRAPSYRPDHCKFTSLPRVRKVVFRNLLSTTLPYPPGVSAKVTANEIVLVLPTEPQFFVDAESDAADDLRHHIKAGDHIKVVMAPTLETKKWSTPVMHGDGHDFDLTVMLARIATFSAKKSLTVYGLGRIQLAPWGSDPKPGEGAEESSAKTDISYLENTMDDKRLTAGGKVDIGYYSLETYVNGTQYRPLEVEDVDQWNLE